MLVLAGLVITQWRLPDARGVDFHTYAAAARVGLESGWSHVYDQGLVAAAQRTFAPHEVAQPFLSPPPVAWLVLPLSGLPFGLAHVLWSAATMLALAVTLTWSATSRGVDRWIALLGALSPVWVVHAIRVGQVVPLVAVGVVVAWRLLREDRDVLAGLALSLVLLKPNTAFLIPVALLAAGRRRAVAAFALTTLTVLGVEWAVVGGAGLSSYVGQLRYQLPIGADTITLHGATGVAGALEMALRGLLVAATVGAARHLRAQRGTVIAVGVLGSLLTAPYLHVSDLTVLAAAAWIVWEERPDMAWRAPLAAGWAIACPYLALVAPSTPYRVWPWVELGLLVAVCTVALNEARSARELTWPGAPTWSS